jgi:hypothetical protein
MLRLLAQLVYLLHSTPRWLKRSRLFLAAFTIGVRLAKRICSINVLFSAMRERNFHKVIHNRL